MKLWQTKIVNRKKHLSLQHKIHYRDKYNGSISEILFYNNKLCTTIQLMQSFFFRPFSRIIDFHIGHFEL